MAKLMSTPQLLVASKRADRFKYNRLLKTEELTHLLDPDGVHVIGEHALVDDGIVRCIILMKYRLDSHPHAGLLDLDLAFFNKLKEYEQPEEEESFA